MKKVRLIFISLVCATLVAGCHRQPQQAAIDKLLNNPLPEWTGKLTQVIIADIFTPPVSSRIYLYSSVAAYEALCPSDSQYSSFAGRLKGLNPLPIPDHAKKYDFRIASVIALTTVAQKLVFTGNAIQDMEKEFLSKLDSLHIDPELTDNSVSYGRNVGKHILAWSATDGYLQRTSMPAYIVTKKPGSWQPTPPNYADAVETNWKTLRPMVMDSCSQFKPVPPLPYDTSKQSAFYQAAYQVYMAVKAPGPTDSATAWYWDDNPNTSVTDGHITYFQQKNSPDGHWMDIACSVAVKEKYTALQTASLVSKMAVAIYDAFISCWDAKYTYNYIRPETFINKYIDRNWTPLIQTPPFPEYPSGHSVASSSASAVLTGIIGDHYQFIDSAEVAFGRPTRQFDSFYAASDQACMSRLYGGIHFMDAIEKGKEQGRKLGGYVVEKLK